MPGLQLQQTMRAQVVLLSCPQHALFTPQVKPWEQQFCARWGRESFLESQHGRAFFFFSFFFCSTSQRLFGRLYKNKLKKKSPPKFKQNFSLSSFTRSRASPIVTDHTSLTLLQKRNFWEKCNLRPIPCFYMEKKSQPQFFPLKTSVPQVTMPKLHLGIYIAVGVFPPVFTICPLIVTLRYTVYWGTPTLLQLLLNNCIVKKNSDQMCCERGALRHPSN